MLDAADFPTEACCSCTELDRLRWTGSSRCSQVLCSRWRDGRLFPGLLPLWTATDSLWRRYLNEFSPVVSFRRLPRSFNMCCQGVDFRPTVTAGVGTKKGGTQAQTNCHPDSLSSIQRLREEIDRASNQAPDSFAEAASRRALPGIS